MQTYFNPVMRNRTNAGVSAHGDGVSNPKSLQGEASQFLSTKNIFIICLVFRVVNSLFVQTYFNPDEHWQALEVAHRITFGYTHMFHLTFYMLSYCLLMST